MMRVMQKSNFLSWTWKGKPEIEHNSAQDLQAINVPSIQQKNYPSFFVGGDVR